MVGSGGDRSEGGKGTGGGGPSDGFRVGIKGRIGSGRGGSIGGGGEKHIQWGERIKWSGVERSGAERVTTPGDERPYRRIVETVYDVVK